MTERKYRMTRLSAGDYLLPSNDLTIMWRITRYWENGNLEQMDDDGIWRSVKGWRWRQQWLPMDDCKEKVGSTDLDDMGWQDLGGVFPTRAEAVDDALTRSPKR